MYLVTFLVQSVPCPPFQQLRRPQVPAIAQPALGDQRQFHYEHLDLLESVNGLLGLWDWHRAGRPIAIEDLRNGHFSEPPFQA
jgi:hypothetical protein